jgi:quercetin dioxygenase-like cupin family protein
MSTLSTLHEAEKEVSAKPLFKGTDATITALQIKQGAVLKEHVTKVPALLICVSGRVVFENEKGLVLELSSGNYFNIEPMVKHWVKALEDSQLVLAK